MIYSIVYNKKAWCGKLEKIFIEFAWPDVENRVVAGGELADDEEVPVLVHDVLAPLGPDELPPRAPVPDHLPVPVGQHVPTEEKQVKEYFLFLGSHLKRVLSLAMPTAKYELKMLRL